MNDKNFDMSSIDDIVINSGNVDKNANLKKGLTVAAGVVVLFLIILIIMKAINKDDIDTNAGLTMPSEEELAKAEQKPAVKVQKLEPSQPEPVEVKSEPNTASAAPTKVEIKTQEPNSESKVVASAQPEAQKVEIQKPEIKEEPKKSEVKIESKKIEPKDEAKKPEKTDVKKPEPKKESAKDEIKKEPSKTEIRKVEQKVEPKKEPEKQAKTEVKKEPSKTEAKKEHAKAEIKKEPAKPEPKKEASKQESKSESVKAGVAAKSTSTSVANGSYVQVFASNAYDPNGSDTKKITKKGYSPIALQTHVGSKSVTKILVGPFEGEALQKALSDMRSINSGAYIYRVK